MKIGILTFHRASNYGAVLQAYALTEVLRGLGADAEIIDYRCPEVERCHNPKFLFKKESLPKACIHYYGKKKKFRNFEAFRHRKLHLSSLYTRDTISKASDKYDAIISGSDQVWSKKYSGMDLTYLLDFESKSQKKYSYAASFGFTAFPQDTMETYRTYLQKFSVVSVREQSAVELLQSECQIPASMNLDPTLLLGGDKWRKFAKLPTKNRYILIYRVQPPKNLIAYAKHLSEKTGLPIVYLNSSYTDHRDLFHARFSSPEEFVGWFVNAEYVLTNSFHGTAFSVILQKQFAVEIETQQSVNTRSRDLLTMAGLEDCILKCEYQDYEIRQADWKAVQSRLDVSKNTSVAYLQDICNSLK